MSRYVSRRVRQLKAYTTGEQPVAEDLLKLNTNENPYPPSPAVLRVLREASAASLRLYPDPVCAELRAAIAALHGCSPAQVFVANGSDEILALCTRAFVEDDGTVGYFNPSYSLYPVLAAIRGVDVRPVELDESFGWRMEPGYSASLFFLTTPNAPTGIQYPRAEVEAFCRVCEGVVVLDEAYVDFADEDFASLALKRRNVLVARSFSKSYALAGIRLGYALGDAELIGALMKVKDSYNVSRLTQEMGLAAVLDRPYMLEQARRVRATRERVADALARRGCRVVPSATNFLWVQPRDGNAAAVFDGLRRRAIFVRYFPGPRTGTYLRISIGTDEQMERFLAAWDAVVTEVKL